MKTIIRNKFSSQIMHIRNISPFVAIFLTITLSAQTVRWEIAPEYSEISCISPSLLRVKQNGLYGLFGADRKPIVACTLKDITDVVEDRCLLLSSNGRIEAIFDSSGDLVKQFGPNEDLYIDQTYPYYSEGFLPVCDNHGKWTYLDKQGNALSSSPSFKNAAPFLFGYSAVRYKDGSYMHINSRGTISKLDKEFKSNYLVYASSFTQEAGPNGNGLPGNIVAVIVDKGNNVFLRNVAGGKVASLGVVKDWNKADLIMTTDKFVIELEANRQIRSILSLTDGTSKQYRPLLIEKYVPSVDNMSIESSHNRYGIMQNGKEILPVQFEEQPFFIAPTEFVVKKNGYYGVLVIDNTHSPNIELKQTRMLYKHHKPMNIRAMIEINPLLNDSDYHILVKRNGSTLYEGSPKGSEFSFDFLPEELKHNNTEAKFNIYLEIDGIKHKDTIVKQTISYENTFAFKIQDEVILNADNKSGTVLISVTNDSASESDYCDIIVDKEIIKKNVRFEPKERITLSVSKSIDIEDLDSVTKNLVIQIKERGCPEYKVSKNVTFVRNL